jgi:ribokinase
MPSTHTILAVGDLVWDVVVKPDRVLLPGGDTTGRIALAPGGSAANVAAWVARVGGEAGFVGKVGADDFGDLIVREMEAEGVALYVTRTAQHETGVILVLVDEHGQRSHVTNQGADFQLLPDDLPNAALAACAHVHITAWSLFNDPPRTAAIAAAQRAKAAGATVSLDPASYQMILEMGVDAFNASIAELPVDILLPNRDEGHALTGEHEPAAIARALRQRYPAAIVALKLDRDGCYVAAPDHEGYYPTGGEPALDATGAGDAFNAGFVAAYARNGNLATAARLANTLGNWVVTRSGARPHIDDALRRALDWWQPER